MITVSKLKLNFDVYAKYSNDDFIKKIISNVKLLENGNIKEYQRVTKIQDYQSILKDMNKALQKISKIPNTKVKS